MADAPLRIKRRLAGAPGGPTTLANGEIAVNEVDGGFYYGRGVASDGLTATQVVRLNPPAPALPALAVVAASGSYDDLEDKPVIPTVPALAPVATSGSYTDLDGRPSIPPAANPATADALGLVKAGAGLLAASDGTLTVDGAAPVALSGPIPDDAQLIAVLGTGGSAVAYYVGRDQVQAWAAGGTTPTPTPTPTGPALTLAGAVFTAGQFSAGTGTAALTLPTGPVTIEMRLTAAAGASGELFRFNSPGDGLVFEFNGGTLGGSLLGNRYSAAVANGQPHKVRVTLDSGPGAENAPYGMRRVYVDGAAVVQYGDFQGMAPNPTFTLSAGNGVSFDEVVVFQGIKTGPMPDGSYAADTAGLVADWALDGNGLSV